MKITLFSAFLLLTGQVLAAAEKPACCKACCEGEKPVATTGSGYTAKSLYQLDSTWTSDAGDTLTLGSLRGRPVVLAMFFASCEYACPVLVSDMQRLRETLPDEIRARAQFVLVTFDVARDTPSALKAYRERSGLDRAWTLLHGSEASVQELGMLLGVKYKQDGRGQFSHSNLITILNDDGEVAFQRNGLMGDVSEAAKALVVASR